MERPNPWTQAAIGAGRTAFGASFFPFATLLAVGMGRTYGSAMAVLIPGGALFLLAFLATIVLALAGGRSPGGGRGEAIKWLGGSLACLFAQAVVAVAIAMAWGTSERHRSWRTPRHRSAPARPSSR